MSPTKTATPPAPAVEAPTPFKAKAAQWILSVALLLGGLGVSYLSAYISYHTIQDLALYVGQPAETAWMLMPIIEIFILTGMVASQLAQVRGGTGKGGQVLAYGAALASVACNVAHPLVMTLGKPVPPVAWVLWFMTGFSALAPLGQLFSVHLVTKELAQIAQQYQVVKPQQGQKATALIGQALAQRAVAAIQQGTPPAAAPGPVPARVAAPARAQGPGRAAKRTGPAVSKVTVMRTFWDAERAAGRLPTAADLDRVAGTNRVAKKYIQRWLDEERGVPHLEDRRAVEQ